MKKILVMVHQLANRSAPYLDRLRSEGFEVEITRITRFATEEEMMGILPGVYGVIASGEPYTERVLSAAGDLRIIARFGVGADNVDVNAATRHGVVVAMAYGANHESVADGTLGLITACAVGILDGDKLVRSGGWGASFHYGVYRKTIGLFGLGRIGMAVARRCRRGFDMQVLGSDPAVDRQYAADNGIELVEADELLARSDFVSLHLAPSPANVNFIDAAKLSLMKRTAFLINTARGPMVDEDALLRAVETGRIAGAGLDVYRKEPPRGSPLLACSKVVLLPHCLSLDDTGELAAGGRCVESILSFWRGDGPEREFVLNPSCLKRGSQRVSE